jgi:predicted transcriptional regulator
MESRRRTIELDETLADALEKRAAERGVSVEEHVSDLVSQDAGEVVLPPAELIELEAALADWDENRLGVPLDEVIEWMESWGRPEELPQPRVRRL